MSTNLVIVESPAKCKTISKYLNSSKDLKHYGKFVVVASMGHIRDLPKKELGIDIEHGFLTTYKVSEDKKKVVADLVKKRRDADFVWLATDADLEGAAISNSIKEELKLHKDKYKRIVFTEITQKALENAFRNAGDIDYKKVDAQETRRILDRLVGFKLSPLLWGRFKGVIGLSAGRVQSAALNILVQKENEIKEFSSKSYWSIAGTFVLNYKHELDDIKLYDGDNKVYKESQKTNATKLLKAIGQQFYVSGAKGRQTRIKPDLPFITSTLQQEAHGKLGFTIKKTMSIAQELYENGYITYMRTDSYNLNEDFSNSVISYIKANYGGMYVGGDDADRKAKRIKKSAQEAHEAIRPTRIDMKDSDLGGDHQKLYDMIWKRTAAYFMKPAVYDEVDLQITEAKLLEQKGMHFLATFKKCKFNGFQIVYGIFSEKYDFSELLSNSKTYKVESKHLIAKNTWMSPPCRYNEGSLVKILEQEGIGRPSTYATILSKLFDKQYCIKTDVQGIQQEAIHMKIIPGVTGSFEEIKETVCVGAERSKFVPTDIGIKILEFLQQDFDYIIDRQFTAHMEADLDKIADGEKTRNEVLTMFWKRFGTDIIKQQRNKAPKELIEAKSKQLVVGGTSYTIRIARYGPVIQEGKNFIGLKPYLKYMKKEYLDITEEDVEFLNSMPVKIGCVDGKDANIVYGPYGFYVKWNGMNVKLYDRVIIQFIKTRTVDEKDLQSSIEYAKNKSTKPEIDNKSNVPKKLSINRRK